jgi:hypothetical protein
MNENIEIELEVKNLMKKVIYSHQKNQKEEITFIKYISKEHAIFKDIKPTNETKKFIETISNIFHKYSNSMDINQQSYEIMNNCLIILTSYFKKNNDKSLIKDNKIFKSSQQILNKWFYKKFNLVGKIYHLYGVLSVFDKNNEDKYVIYFKNFLDFKIIKDLMNGRFMGKFPETVFDEYLEGFLSLIEVLNENNFSKMIELFFGLSDLDLKIKNNIDLKKHYNKLYGQIKNEKIITEINKNENNNENNENENKNHENKNQENNEKMKEINKNEENKILDYELTHIKIYKSFFKKLFTKIKEIEKDEFIKIIYETLMKKVNDQNYLTFSISSSLLNFYNIDLSIIENSNNFINIVDCFVKNIFNSEKKIFVHYLFSYFDSFSFINFLNNVKNLNKKKLKGKFFILLKKKRKKL